MAIPGNWTHRYNAPVPPEFVCPLSKKIMQQPMAAVCETGHTSLFDYAKIAQWVRSTWICPMDKGKITHIYPMAAIKTLYDRWHKEHVLIKVEPQALAEWILMPHFRPSMSDLAKLGPMLRFIQGKHYTDETAGHLARLARQYDLEIPDAGQRIPEGLDPHPACVFELILAKARLEIRNFPAFQYELKWDPIIDFSASSLVEPDPPRSGGQHSSHLSTSGQICGVGVISLPSKTNL